MNAEPTYFVLDQVATWPGIRTQPTPRGATAIMLEGRELGHLHPDRRTLDMPLTHHRRAEVSKHRPGQRLVPRLVSKPLASERDAQDGLALLRESYEELQGTKEDLE